MPYAPGIEYRGDQYLFQGISQAGAGVAEGIKQWREERKQSKKVESAYDAMATGLTKMAEAGSPIPPGILDQFRKLGKGSTEEKAGAMQGAGEVLKMFLQLDETGRQNKQLGLMAEQLKLAQEAQGNDTKKTAALLNAQERQQEFGGRLAEHLTGRPATRKVYPSLLTEDQRGPNVADFTGGTVETPEVPAGELTPAAIARIGGQTGALTPEGFTQLTSMAQRDDSGKPQVLTMDMPDGTKVQGIWTRVQGFQTVGADAKDPSKPIVIQDEKKQPMFFGLHDGKGGIDWKPARSGMQPTSIPGVWMVDGRLVQIDAKNQMLYQYAGPAPGMTATGFVSPEVPASASGQKIPKYDQQGNRLN